MGMTSPADLCREESSLPMLLLSLLDTGPAGVHDTNVDRDQNKNTDRRTPTKQLYGLNIPGRASPATIVMYMWA